MYVTKERAASIALAMYRDEPCRICGEKIGDDLDPVFAGYSADNKSRAAHRVCWDKRPEKEQWAFPGDA